MSSLWARLSFTCACKTARAPLCLSTLPVIGVIAVPYVARQPGLAQVVHSEIGGTERWMDVGGAFPTLPEGNALHPR
jgi:hypothetical protein